jgi:hypothetical protein
MIKGIMELLLADSGVTALVSQKIFPVIAEEKIQTDYVTIRRTGTSPTIVKNETSGKDETFFNVTAYSKEYKKCIEILAAVRIVLDNFRGDSNSITFLNIWYQVSEDLFDKEDETYVVVDTYAARVKR